MIVRTFRLGAGSVVCLTMPDLRDELADHLYRRVADAFGALGVPVVVLPENAELSILTGPSHPVEIGTVGPAR